MIIPFPDKKYDVIYADPPWSYTNNNKGTLRENYYSRMTIDEIRNLDVKRISNNDSVLYLWVVYTHVPDALKVIESWGFKYKSQYVWAKDKIGMGYWVRSQHELLFICVKGKVKPPIPSLRRSSVIHAPRRKHSEKPEEVYDILNEQYSGLAKIELFARKKVDGWDNWGNELG